VAVSTTVVLEVTPRHSVDPDRHANKLPADLAAAFSAAGQPLNHGLSRSGAGQWRFHFHLSGPDRLLNGQALERDVRKLGYEADLIVSP
jgi:hypothetical protein